MREMSNPGLFLWELLTRDLVGSHQTKASRADALGIKASFAVDRRN